MAVAQIRKEEFDRLRDLMGVAEGGCASNDGARGFAVAKEPGCSRVIAAFADIAPWKLVVLAVLFVAAAVLALAVTGVFDKPQVVLRGKDVPGAIEGDVQAGSAVPSDGVAQTDVQGALAEPEPEPGIWVHVAGAVRDPGVYLLPEGARVADAVAAAGGAAEGGHPDALNLAAPLADGSKVAVPSEGEEGVPTEILVGNEVSNGLVNVNTAGVEELQALPGIGPALAAAIVEEREANGPFDTVEDLLRVGGIGEKKLEKLADGVAL